MTYFDFGTNWKAFSERRLDDTRVDAAVASLQRLLPGRLDGKGFLDVGCGTGLFAIAASRLGASPILGIDVNAICVSVAKANVDRLAAGSRVEFRVASALDEHGLGELGVFDVVYAWGSLHHTGAMWKAIDLTSRCVSEGGTLVLAIYAKHFTSPLWTVIKRLYNLSPALIQRIMEWSFGGIIYVAKFLVTGRNPLAKDRGMDFWFDVIDWVGGYPYEYATPGQIEGYMTPRGFRLRALIPATVPTGCNEFVFQKLGPGTVKLFDGVATVEGTTWRA